MEISIDQFKKEVDALDKKIKDDFKEKETPKRKLIEDGIVNLEEYYNSPIKIMWVLKEPYDDKENGGGGWSITKDLNDNRALGKKNDSPNTWHPIIYSTYGILNNFLKIEKMPQIPNNTSMSLVLRKIAFINIQKLPARPNTNDASLKKAYSNNKEINKKLLLKQISIYRPDIVIGGKTLHLLKDDLQITNENELSFGHFTKEKKLFINTFHPNQRKISRADYVNKIITRAEEWKSCYS